MWVFSLWHEGLHLIQLAAVLGGVSAAAWTDLRAKRIPNALTGPMAITGLAWAGWNAGVPGIADALTACLLLALPYVILFVVAGGGAGDAKLMGAVGAWLGVVHGLIVLVCVALAGIVIAVIWALMHRQGAALANNLVGIVVNATGPRGDRTASLPHQTESMPYGVAIFVGVCGWLIGALLWG